LEGLLHISELADHKIDKPQDIVSVGDEVEVKILKVDTDARKIGLSLRRVQWAAEEQAGESVKQRAPSVTEKVVSDADLDRLTKAEEKVDAEPGESGKEEGEAADAGEAQVTEDPLLQDERKEAAPEESEQTAGEQPQESSDTEPVRSESDSGGAGGEPGTSKGAESQVSDGGSAEEKTEGT